MNNLNKKLINNFVLGSFLFGVSVGTITQVQATQRAYTVRPKVHEYVLSATDNLEERLGRRNLSMEECIRFVRDREANPNIQAHFHSQGQNESLTLLEEAILSRYPEALEIFIKHGADVFKVSSGMKKFGEGVTLLHLALLTPDEMKALDKIRSVGVQNHAAVDIIQAFREQQSKEFLKRMGLDQTEEAIPPPSPYVPKAVLELLMNNGLESKLNAKDKYDKTILDWAIERRCIALEKSQKLESDLKIIAEYGDVIELLLSKDMPCNKENETMQSKIMMWEVKVSTTTLQRNLPPTWLRELRQWRQKLEETQSKN
ncbi:MAG: hypothetical protein LBR92_01815 [Puniceicoccales bacterium]|nr:hypothetical protein [Puniceicoccales bacterium]